MKQRSIAAAWVLGVFLVTSAPAGGPDSAYVAEVVGWRAERMAELRAADGYLNLAGLFWLEDGRVSFGGSTDNDLRFPGALADHIGYFDIAAGKVTMHVSDGALVLFDRNPVTTLSFDTASDAPPIPAQMGSLFWYVIERAGRPGLRLHDLASPALERLPPMPYFDIDRRFRVTARLKPYPEPRTLSVGTVIDGLPYEPESPGVLEFEIDGRAFELEAYSSGDRLFLVFGDATSGRETYGAGRFLYAEKPDEDGVTVLDFNKSYNPPCAFNDFSTCPVASPRNRLAVRIQAGERFIDSLYLGTVDY